MQKEKHTFREHSLDTFLRPPAWDLYIGQEELKNNLYILIEAAKKRNQAPEHVLLYGPAGLGKTTLAHLIGKELNVPVRTASGATLNKASDVISLFSAATGGGVIFIDEIHRLNKNIEEVLYPIMESGGIDIMVGKGPTARSVRINMPPITIIAATTQIGKLSHPLRTRFSGGTHKLAYYTTPELVKIITHSAEKLGVALDTQSAEALAIRSRSTPRIANYLLKRVRDYAEVHNKKINPAVVTEALLIHNIDEYGLTEEDRQFLQVIHKQFKNGPVGLQTLAHALSEDEVTLEEVHEPYLLQLGFIERSPRGRKLTDKGIAYIQST